MQRKISRPKNVNDWKLLLFVFRMLSLISGAIAGTVIVFYYWPLPQTIDPNDRNDIFLFAVLCFVTVITLICSMSLFLLFSLWIRKIRKLFINKSFSLFLTGLFYSMIYLYILGYIDPNEEWAIHNIEILKDVLGFVFYPALSLIFTFLLLHLIYKVLPNKLCRSKKNIDAINIRKN